MNMPPKCEWDVPSPCICRGTIWTVLDKTTGKYHEICSNHLVTIMDPEHTFVIHKATDYSKPRTPTRERPGRDCPICGMMMTLYPTSGYVTHPPTDSDCPLSCWYFKEHEWDKLTGNRCVKPVETHQKEGEQRGLCTDG